MYIYARVYMYIVHVCARVHVCTCAHMGACICVCMRVPTHVCVCVCDACECADVGTWSSVFCLEHKVLSEPEN